LKKLLSLSLALLFILSLLASCNGIVEGGSSNERAGMPSTATGGSTGELADFPDGNNTVAVSELAFDGPRGNSGDDPANGIYVSPSGNDATATGAIDKPYKSINTALAAAKPGDTILLRGGTYREGVNVRVRIPNITIKSAKGEWAVIDLSRYDAGHDEDSGVYFDVDSSGGRLQSVEVIGGFYAVCMETKWRWGGKDDWVAAKNIIIEDCVLHDSRYDVVKVKPNCDNITIRFNEIYNSGRAFGNDTSGEKNAEGIDNVNGDNMVVQNNYIHDIISTGIYAKGGATDVLIENNRIERAYGAGIMVGFDTSPDFFDLEVNPQYYESIRCVVRNNLIIDAGWEGIGFYGSKDAQVYNNTLVNVVTGGQYHSAIYFGLTYQDWDTKAGRPSNVNPSIHHNIVCQPASFNRPMIEIRYSHELGGLSALNGNPVMNNNCYFITGKKAAFADFRPGKILESAGLAAWQSHISGDSGTVEVDPGLDDNYIATNPLCADMGISSAFAAAPSMKNFRVSKSYSRGQFSDVNEDAWYGYNKEKSIVGAYEYGLMAGTGDKTFNPTGVFTVAEAVALAARVHSIYTTDYVLKPSSVPWYKAYVSYAVDNGIIKSGDFSESDYGRPATRAEMAYVFSRALPEGEYAPQNTITSLPDVNGNTPYYSAILLLYKAGVFTGSDDKGSFQPGNSITRAEVAVIISRVILPGMRASGRTYG